VRADDLSRGEIYLMHSPPAACASFLGKRKGLNCRCSRLFPRDWFLGSLMLHGFRAYFVERVGSLQALCRTVQVKIRAGGLLLQLLWLL
jgi:hypothetical protein